MKKHLLDQSPLPIAERWHGLWASGLDAAINRGNGKMYFFKGDEYVRYDFEKERVDPGYPLKISKHWHGLWESGIDAAVNRGNGKVYFFKGDEYMRYDLDADRVDPGYPLKIANQWPGFWSSGIDAVINWGNGNWYAFKGADYLRYDIEKGRTNEGYPLPIVGRWPGLFLAPTPHEFLVNYIKILPENQKLLVFDRMEKGVLAALQRDPVLKERIGDRKPAVLVADDLVLAGLVLAAFPVVWELNKTVIQPALEGYLDYYEDWKKQKEVDEATAKEWKDWHWESSMSGDDWGRLEFKSHVA